MLLRAKVSKGRYTFKLKNCIRKVYYRTDWLEWHQIIEKYTGNVLQYVDVMEKVFPGYLIQHGYFSKNAYFFDYKILPGKSIASYEHTTEFVERFRQFCIDSIKETSPYSHGDWTPDNVLDYQGKWTLIDWDCVGLRSTTETQHQLNKNLKKVFKFKDVDTVKKRELLFMEKH